MLSKHTAFFTTLFTVPDVKASFSFLAKKFTSYPIECLSNAWSIKYRLKKITNCTDCDYFARRIF